eukprot:2529734-Pleurochrysis_carterae.AAC.6
MRVCPCATETLAVQAGRASVAPGTLRECVGSSQALFVRRASSSDEVEKGATVSGAGCGNGAAAPGSVADRGGGGTADGSVALEVDGGISRVQARRLLRASFGPPRNLHMSLITICSEGLYFRHEPYGRMSFVEIDRRGQRAAIGGMLQNEFRAGGAGRPQQLSSAAHELLSSR